MSIRDTDDFTAEERRALRFRDGSREPSALRLAAIRERARPQWRAVVDREKDRRHKGATRAALAATCALAAAVLLVVTPPEHTPMTMADASSCASAYGAGYCPADGEEGWDGELAACRLFSPHPMSCF